MNRRSVLVGAGSLLSLGIGRRALGTPDRTLSIRLWITTEAAAYPGLQERAADYVRHALAPIERSIDVSFGEAPLAFDADDRAVERSAWPRRVLEGVAGVGPVDPVRDVNLLLTDGDVSGRTAGYAYDHIAAVPGARHLATLPPASDCPRIVDYDVPTAIGHLLLHEVGHALGLTHEHGRVDVAAGTVTASPMVSGYAWAPDDVRQDAIGDLACSEAPPGPDDRARRLEMGYAPCALERLRAYRGLPGL